MTFKNNLSESIKLSEEQIKEGYWVEQSDNNILVWNGRNQIALLYLSPDIGYKVNDVIERRRRELRDVVAKTGWKPDYQK